MSYVGPRSRRPTEFVVLYSHGNAKDIGGKLGDYIDMQKRFNCDVFSYDYPGYGQSTGVCSEAGLYEAIDVAFETLTRRYGIKPSRIILYGHSLGTVAAIDLASRQEVAGVILNSPLLSAVRLVCSVNRKKYFWDLFDGSSKLEKIRAPVLVIHGQKDEIIHHSHGETIHKQCKNKVAPLFLPEASHNSCNEFPEYTERISTFIHKEIKAQQIPTSPDKTQLSQ